MCVFIFIDRLKNVRCHMTSTVTFWECICQVTARLLRSLYDEVSALCSCCSVIQAQNQSLDLQETIDRVEKVVYWYNCLQHYLKSSRKRLEILDPVATDLVDVAKQLKHCKVCGSLWITVQKQVIFLLDNTGYTFYTFVSILKE